MESEGGSSGSSHRSRTNSRDSRDNEIESLVSALQNYPHPLTGSPVSRPLGSPGLTSKMHASPRSTGSLGVSPGLSKKTSRAKLKVTGDPSSPTQLRVLIVEVCFLLEVS